MVVETSVKMQSKAKLLRQFGTNTAAMIDYLFKNRMLDVNKCRIAIIKERVTALKESGSDRLGAVVQTAEEYRISEKTVENILYNPFYKDIQW